MSARQHPGPDAVSRATGADLASVVGRPRSRSVVDQLREAILEGAFAPRERLVEAELCDRFDASRAAVRAALQQLAFEGLVELQRNRGARVKALSVEEAVEITEVRMALEGLCASLAAQRATAKQRGRLRTVLGEMEEAVRRGDTQRYHDLNAVLHHEIYEAAQNTTCIRLLAHFRAQMVRHQFVLAFLPGRPRRSLDQHRAIVEAICAGRAVEAEAAMRSHLQDVIEALRRLPPALVTATPPTTPEEV
jgi:DNA-binding GntR family transcriptional regulator